MIPATPDPRPIEFTTVAEGSRGGPEVATEVVIRDAAAFADFFGGEPPTADIDWENEVVTAVALGERPHTAHSVTIESIELYDRGIRGGSVDVRYREDVGEVGGRALVYPFHAVKSQRFAQAAFYRVAPHALPAELFGDWFGPVDRAPDGVEVYVPRDQAPLSRSVAGFVIHEDGRFTNVADAPGDGPLETDGSWLAITDGIEVELADFRGFRLEILSVDASQLRVRRTSTV
ncbi:MAG: hypothetical protein WBL05_05055 [Brooklawnia sp.]|uniref:hypothetical protein n=1 Tax=Brooklawnia sp. TaxID=2699740 RepID=UPI003C78E446